MEVWQTPSETMTMTVCEWVLFRFVIPFTITLLLVSMFNFAIVLYTLELQSLARVVANTCATSACPYVHVCVQILACVHACTMYIHSQVLVLHSRISASISRALAAPVQVARKQRLSCLWSVLYKKYHSSLGRLEGLLPRTNFEITQSTCSYVHLAVYDCI